MTDEKKEIKIEEANTVAGGSVASGDYDRCPMCDTPTPVIGGRCTCPNCGHSWGAGSH